jgi:dipeptidyl aminopeptidase/acylaminoacyl peptidase
MAGAVAESKRTGKPVIPPLLILHGDTDLVVPLANAEGFRKGLRMHGLPFEYVVYPGEGHEFAEQGNWVDMLLRIGRWCDTYLGSEGVGEDGGEKLEVGK